LFLKFTYEDAYDLSRMIRRRRPDWNQKAIMNRLQTLAEGGASLTQATAAAEKTWNNPKARTPDALLWPEHWQQDKQAAVGLERLCIECTKKHPIGEMTNFGGTWKCRTCTEAVA
jgi:hypothetical protein